MMLEADARPRLRPLRPMTLQEAITHVEDAQRRGDLGEALERAGDVITEAPELAYGHAAKVRILSALGRQEEAEAAAIMGLASHSAALDLLLAAIDVAMTRRDWEAASARVMAAAASFPGHPWVQARKSACLAATEAAREIEARDAERREARDCEKRGDWERARVLWASVAGRPEGARDAMLGIARCRDRLGQAPLADALFREAIARNPADVEIMATYALSAARRGHWAEASARWEEFLDRFPEARMFDGEIAVVFARNGSSARAEELLVQAIEREPRSVDLRQKHAILAEIAEDWHEALRRWDVAIEIRPDDIILKDFRGQAAWELDLQNSGSHNRRVGPVSSLDPPFEEMLLRFDSLGDNCEFGLVQRHFGVEPASLFRFSATKPSNVLELLERDLAPLGDPAHTRVEEQGDEYVVIYDRGYYNMHSFARVGQVDPQRLLRQQGSRIELLRRKLLKQLEEGGRIYVCKDSVAPIADDLLLRMGAALRARGNNVLLGIRLADAEHPPGTLCRIESRILVGYLPTLYLRKRSRIAFAAWEALLRKAYTEAGV